MCPIVATKPCTAVQCQAVMALGKKRLVRQDATGPQQVCWTEYMQLWLSYQGDMRTLYDLPEDEFMLKVHQFLEQVPDMRPLVGLTGDVGTPNHRLVFSNFVFQSTFVEPKPQRDTREVVDEWDKAVREVMLSAPPGVNDVYATGGYGPAAVKYAVFQGAAGIEPASLDGCAHVSCAPVLITAGPENSWS